MAHIRQTIGRHILKIGVEGLEALQKEATEKAVDFHKHVAATALGKGVDDVTTVERNEAKTLLFAYNFGVKAAVSDELFLNIDRATLHFTRDPSLHKAWRADFEGGVVILTREDQGPAHVTSRYLASFQTTSGAVIAEGAGIDRVYMNGIGKVGCQEAVTNMWEKVEHEVDRFRLLLRLSTR
jgi:hypothetical protein